MKRRVVITGLGVVAPNGIGKDEFWQALISGKSGIDKITSFDASDLPSQIAGEVNDFDPTLYLSPKKVKRTSRVSQFAVATAKMAVEDSGLEITDENRDKIGVCFGTSLGKADIFEKDHVGFLEKKLEGIELTTWAEFTSHAGTSHISIELGTAGITDTVATGCATGLDVINHAYSQIQHGRSNIVIAGCAESLLFPFTFSVFCGLRALSTRNEEPQAASRPYNRDSDGLVLSEGGTAVILESLESALDREVNIYAEVLGFANAGEALDLRKCDTTGQKIAEVIEQTVIRAGIAKKDVDYINAHGNSLPDYDLAETNGFKRVFGKRAYNIPVSSVKSMTGQPFAASGGFQVVSSCLTIQNNLIPPTINYEKPAPELDLDYGPNFVRHARVRNVLMNAHSLGGTHSVLAIGALS